MNQQKQQAQNIGNLIVIFIFILILLFALTS